MADGVIHQERNDSKLPDDDLIPAVHFDPHAAPERHRIDYYHESARRVYDVSPAGDGAPRMGVSYKAWRLDNLVFSRVIGCAHTVSRRPDHLRQYSRDYVRLRIYRKGQSRILFGDQPVRLQPGEIHLFDYSRTFQDFADAHIQSGVYLPYTAIGYDPSIHPQHMCFSLGSPTGRVLGDAFSSLEKQLPLIRQSQALALAAGFSGLVRGLIQPGKINSDTLAAMQAARGRAMRAYLEQNLRDPALGITNLCLAFGASRATIYRDFVTDGGIAHYLIRRRLEQAFVDLANGPPRRGRIHELAEIWGFASVSHFSHRFREQFGFSPSDAAGLALCGAAAAAPIWPQEPDLAKLQRPTSWLLDI